MDRMIAALSERLSTRRSRRSMIVGLGKSALKAGVVGGALASGLGLGADVAEAFPYCCSGAAACPTASCPPNTTATFVNVCCSSTYSNPQYYCYNCRSSSNCYICTYGAFHAYNCPQVPVP